MDGVRWLAGDDAVDLGYWVLFARGLTAAEALTRMGLDAASGALLTREEAQDVADESDTVVVRAGTSAGWAYAFVEGGPAGTDPLEAVRRLSAGTEAVDVWRTVNADQSLGHAVDGRLVCRFEPGREHERVGSDPGRPDGAMRRAGLLLPDGSAPHVQGITVDRTELRTLALAESEFGLDLPRREVLEGRLLSAALPD
ncbi:DUF6461 domain-containing protein [Streptomyces fragilis]|uniref:DUF6461 domain-containing protein n=1 Tax=Streptomyces fragilis TaxID=67301 RepID=A0ABV2YGS0_9ACTN|nr:DUF6461 domain-containing protein [Streptomyces fragilis]